MSITRGDFLRSLGKSLPGLVASTGMATAAEALIRRVAQACPAPALDKKPASDIPFFEHGSAVGNQIALTFDDGPVPGVTELILDELRKRGVRATFFLIGRQVALAPELARRVIAEGHEVGNHTFTHRKLSDLSDTEAAEELDRTERVFAELLHDKTDWLRPPFGAFRRNQGDLAISRKLGVALWNVDSEDWRIPGQAGVLENILTKTEAGSIILCHELSKTAAGLPQIMDSLLQKGFNFATISTLADGVSRLQ